jgi:peroxiredoxin
MCAAVLAAAPQTGPRRAPGFALPDSRMQVFDLNDYHGKVVLLELMMTTCPHCAPFAGILQKVRQQYGDKVQVLSVVNSASDNQNTVAQYIAGHKVDYPILFDAGQMMYSYVRAMNIDYPHVYLIDGDGMIRADFLYGLTTRDIFEGNGIFKEIDKVLGRGGK